MVIEPKNGIKQEDEVGELTLTGFSSSTYQVIGSLLSARKVILELRQWSRDAVYLSLLQSLLPLFNKPD